MATQRKLNGADNEKLWEAMLAAMPTVIAPISQNPPKGSANIARQYARAFIDEWRSAVRSAK